MKGNGNPRIPYVSTLQSNTKLTIYETIIRLGATHGRKLWILTGSTERMLKEGPTKDGYDQLRKRCLEKTS